MTFEHKLLREMSVKDDPVRELALHKAAYHNDVHTLHKIIRQHDIMEKDVHGNTALHIAVMFGFKECISVLLTHNAPIKIKNIKGWTPLAEAISYGDRHIVTSLLRKLKKQSRESLHQRKEHLLEALQKLDDFYLELKWDFQSWIPLVSKILPSDVCKIYKKSKSLRMDTTLVDFNDRSWERGDVSFIFDSDAVKPGDSLVILDNKAKVFQRIRYDESEMEVEDEVDLLMGSDVVNAQISTKSIHFSRSLAGWIWRHERNETVGEYDANYFNVDGLCLETKKRREHLSFDDVKKNKALVQSLLNGNIDDSQMKVLPRRKSLSAPPRPVIPWEEYLACLPGNPPNLGRPPILKESCKNFKATVAMSEQFPLTVEALLDILEVVAPFKHLNKLRTFCKVRLPPGFPVRIEIPLLPTISAKITFQKLVFKEHTDKNLLCVPSTYREDSHRFPDL